MYLFVYIFFSSFLQVAILDGITMGGGAGISLPGMFRFVTDKTVCDCNTNYQILLVAKYC